MDPEKVSSFLAHYGIKGMHWGIRRDSPSGSASRGPVPVTTKVRPGRGVRTSGGQRQPVSEDALKLAISKRKARASTLSSLSTSELQDAVRRMNLEQQYARLNEQSSKAGMGKLFVKQLFGLAQNMPAPSPGETSDPATATATRLGEQFALEGRKAIG